MFEKTYEDRLESWSNFRSAIESTSDAIQASINQYATAPIVSFQTDPWDQNTWPTPWELILENQYCDFCRLLGICYSLQLTDRFSTSTFEIHIAVDRERAETYYLLFVDEYVVGYDEVSYVHKTELPPTLESQTVYPMKPRN